MKKMQISEILGGNPYVGRGIVTGTAPDGRRTVSAYFIMGRSANSRNRVFSLDGGVLRTVPFDPSLCADPSLIIYNAARVYEDNLIVTNGDQTDTIYDYLRSGKSAADALMTRGFEPDAPNYTPRISSVTNIVDGCFTQSILKTDDGGDTCSRYFFSYSAQPGAGRFIHTYITDGNPLPSFAGEPEAVSIPNDIDEFREEIWSSLDSENKISLYVRYTNIGSGETEERIDNKYAL